MADALQGARAAGATAVPPQHTECTYQSPGQLHRVSTQGQDTSHHTAVSIVLPPPLQDSGLALQALSQAVLALSMSYDCVFFLLELGDALLQPILRGSSDLQALARAAGVRLQLLTCCSAANTQVGARRGAGRCAPCA